MCLAPAHAEAIRGWLLERNKPYAATLVTVIAYRLRTELRRLRRHRHASTLLPTIVTANVLPDAS